MQNVFSDRNSDKLETKTLDQLDIVMDMIDASQQKYHKNMLREINNPQEKIEFRRATEQGYEAEIVGNANFYEVKQTLTDKIGRTDEISLSASGEKNSNTNKDVKLDRFFEYLFTEDEVDEIYEVKVSLGELITWDKSYFISGHSSHPSENVDFGPVDVFQGPKLKYSLINTNCEEVQREMDIYNLADSIIIHPDHHIQQHIEDEQNVDDMLQ